MMLIVSPSALNRNNEQRIDSGMETANQDHDGGKTRRNDRFSHYSFDRLPDEQGLIGDGRNSQVWGQRCENGRQQRPDSRDNVNGRFAA